MFYRLRAQTFFTLFFGGQGRPRAIVLICNYMNNSDCYCGRLAMLYRGRHTGATEYWFQCLIRNFENMNISVPSCGVRPTAVVVLCPSVPSSFSSPSSSPSLSCRPMSVRLSRRSSRRHRPSSVRPSPSVPSSSVLCPSVPSNV